MSEIMAAAPVITVDGPSGSGKGLLSASLARLTGWHLLDSGALYRLVALTVIEQQINLSDKARLRQACSALDAVFHPGDDGIDVQLRGAAVAERLRHEDVGAMASQVAAIAEVREALLQRQRDYRQPPGLIADGRDMGTVVFRDADLKIFLTASARERARRRYQQLLAKGENVKFDSLLREIEARDQRDRERPLAPLRAADDAITIDSTDFDAGQVLEQAHRLLSEHGLISR
ncbi:MAG: (d)CMP kinase [Wenzhouxiangellaceae bacterium]